MAQSDGWVAERLSADHTVVPDLNGWTEPDAAPTGETLESDIFNTDLFSTGGFGDGFAPVSNESKSDGATVRSSVKRVLVGAVVVAVLGIGGLFVAPIISSSDDPVEPPPALAFGDEPTQRLVVSGGSIYLEGSVPDESTSRLFEAAARNALGAERVINNFEISDTAVFDPSQPVLLSVAETVLFRTGQATVNEEYKG